MRNLHTIKGAVRAYMVPLVRLMRCKPHVPYPEISDLTWARIVLGFNMIISAVLQQLDSGRARSW